MKNLTAVDRGSLTRLAAALEKGSPERKALLVVLSKEARYRSWGKSTSAGVTNNWRSKDTPAEQRESLGQSMADVYEVTQTVLMLAKKTEGADPQSVNKALQAIGAAMFSH